jgi:hypothetical protein
MQEMDMSTVSVETQGNEAHETITPTSLLDLPVAKLQIVQSSEVIKADYLSRPMLEPTLAQNTDGLWMLSVRRQGEHSKFEVPYIGSEILLADPELGLVVVLVSYHGSSTEKYGRLGYMTQKGQFYRYYQQQASGDWLQIPWRKLNDDLRSLIITTVEEQGPSWAKSPGKLQAERKPPTKPVTMTSYKVVRLIDGRYLSLYDPTVEYILGERLKQPAKPKHGGGFYSYPTREMGDEFLADCAEGLPFDRGVATSQIALLEVEIGGRIINYGHKMASTYLCPMRVLEVRDLVRC